MMRLLLLGVVVMLVGVPLALLNAGPGPAVKDEVVETFEWKGEKRKRTVRTVNLGGEKMEFVKVPAGEFMMGMDNEVDRDFLNHEKPQHKVTFTTPIWVAKYPVTVSQYAAFVKADKYQTQPEKDGEACYGLDKVSNKVVLAEKKFCWKNPGWGLTDRHPVVNLTWNDAQAFCSWASKVTKSQVRLLSEAEFEYANRGGSTTRFFTGDNPDSLKGYANVPDASLLAKKTGYLDDFPHFEFDDGEPFTSVVGKFKANGFGLHDMCGNVKCWCDDWYDQTIYTSRKDGVSDPKSNQNGDRKFRVIRGSAWDSGPRSLRSSNRSNAEPSYRCFDLGFRVAME